MININLLESKRGHIVSKKEKISRPKKLEKKIPKKKKGKFLKGIGFLSVILIVSIFSFLLVNWILFSEKSNNDNLTNSSDQFVYRKMTWDRKINYQVAYYNKIVPLFMDIIKSDLIWDELIIDIPNRIEFKGSFFNGEKSKFLSALFSSDDLKIVESKRYELGELVQGFFLKAQLKKLYVLESINRVHLHREVEIVLIKWKELVKSKDLELKKFSVLSQQIQSNYKIFHYKAELEAKDYQSLVFVIQEMFLGYSKIGLSQLKITSRQEKIKIVMKLSLVTQIN